MRIFIAQLRASTSRNLLGAVFGLCASATFLVGCASVPIAPRFDPLPPAMASLNLQIGGVDGPPMQKLSKASLEDALRPALFSALSTAGFHMVFDAEVADAIIDITVEPHVVIPAPYRTALTIRGPRGREIDQVKFTGGTIGGSYNSNVEMFEQIAHGVAFNLVAKLVKSPIFLAFAQEPKSRRPLVAAVMENNRKNAENHI